jgi:hypothetical protein
MYDGAARSILSPTMSFNIELEFRRMPRYIFNAAQLLRAHIGFRSAGQIIPVLAENGYQFGAFTFGNVSG